CRADGDQPVCCGPRAARHSYAPFSARPAGRSSAAGAWPAGGPAGAHCLRSGRFRPGGTIVRLVARLLADAEAKARMHSVIEISVLQALAYDALADHQRAQHMLSRIFYI